MIESSTSSPASMADAAYGSILSDLLHGRIQHGQLLNRRDVARQLGMSPAPVLEAMVRLEAEGFLVTLPRRGTQVRIWTIDELAHQIAVREAIECQATYLLLENSQGEHRPLLKQLEGHADQADDQDLANPERWLADLEFHHQLVQLTGNPALTHAHKQSITLSHFAALALNMPVHGPRETLSHRHLLKRLHRADQDSGSALIRTHIRSSLKGLR